MKFILLETITYNGFTIKIYDVRNKPYLMIRIFRNKNLWKELYASSNSWSDKVTKLIA